jgi:hypothetical protein
VLINFVSAHPSIDVMIRHLASSCLTGSTDYAVLSIATSALWPLSSIASQTRTNLIADGAKFAGGVIKVFWAKGLAERFPVRNTSDSRQPSVIAV